MKQIAEKSVFYLLLVFFVALASCNKDSDVSLSNEDELTSLKKANVADDEQLIATNIYFDQIADECCGDSLVANFMAGQHIYAGTVTVKNTEDKLYVSIVTDNGWDMGHVHLYVGSLAGVPLNNKGNPQIGKFPNSNSFTPHVTTVVYEFDLASLDPCFIVAVHAEAHGNEVHGSETAWAEGTAFNAGSWATYIEYCQGSCVVVEPR